MTAQEGQWYYVHNNQRVGPVDEATISGLIQNGAISHQTLVWKPDMANWQPAAQTVLAAKLGSVPPGQSPAPQAPVTYTASAPVQPPVTYAPPAAVYPPESFRKLWLWFAWLLGLGFPLCFVCIGVPALIASVVIFYVLLYRFWGVIQDGAVRSSPGKAVGFCFIPFYNFYWFYVALVGLSKDMNLYCQQRQIDGPRVNEGLALTWYVLWLCSLIPYVGILASIPAVVLQIILMKQLADAAARISGRSAATA